MATAVLDVDFKELLARVGELHEREVSALRARVTRLQADLDIFKVPPERQKGDEIPYPLKADTEKPGTFTLIVFDEEDGVADTQTTSSAVAEADMQALSSGPKNPKSPRITRDEGHYYPSEATSTAHTAVSGSSPHVRDSIAPKYLGNLARSHSSICLGRKLHPEWLHLARAKGRKGVTFAAGSTDVFNMNLRNHSSDNSRHFDGLVAKVALDPDSRVKISWGMIGFLLLLWDIVFVPLDCFMDLPESMLTLAMEWVVRWYWTLDLPLNFLTGVYAGGYLEMRPERVALTYMRSWFMVDFMLVGSDWLAVWWQSEVAGAEALPLLRSFRLMRLMRLMRVTKLRVLNQMLNDMLIILPDSCIILVSMLRIAVILLSLIHSLGCMWYFVGRQDSHGWSAQDAVLDSPFSHRYLTSVYWAVTLIHGTNHLPMSTCIELGFSVIMLLGGFTTLCLFIAYVSKIVGILVDDRAAEMRQVCRRYLQTRKVSARLQIRLNKYLARVHGSQGFRDQVERETELLGVLPKRFQMDLHEELRKPLLVCNDFFNEMFMRDSWIIRKLCFEALLCRAVCMSDLVFLKGDTSTHMLCIESGTFVYGQGLGTRPTTWIRQSVELFSTDGEDILHASQCNIERRPTRGDHASEASLWTQWNHVGDLTAETNGTYLVLEFKVFADIVTQQDNLTSCVVPYARHFVCRLRQLELSKELSDFMDFPVDFATLRDETEDISVEHYVFLSHFKEEAGTEAALMSNAMKFLIAEEEDHIGNMMARPCFLDSSDLSDLTVLTNEVKRSHNLVLLLTPGVFSRPWCLIEVVTAWKENVEIVPVEIQRPGLKFQYPDEPFFERLGNGETMSTNDLKLLRRCGIRLDDVANATRHVFERIAIPFSPHKSETIRNAELGDIMARCTVKSVSEFEAALFL